MEPRPKLNDEMKLAAARKLVAEMVKNGTLEIEGDAELYAKDVAKHGTSWGDGYELAKALDSHCHWDCNLMIAEALDNFASYADSEVVRAEKEWVTRCAIEPPYPLGTRVKLNRSGEAGILDEVYTHGHAKYCVKIDGDPQAKAPTKSRRIVNFEDVAPIVAAAVPA